MCRNINNNRSNKTCESENNDGNIGNNSDISSKNAISISNKRVALLTSCQRKRLRAT